MDSTDGNLPNPKMGKGKDDNNYLTNNVCSLSFALNINLRYDFYEKKWNLFPKLL